MMIIVVVILIIILALVVMASATVVPLALFLTVVGAPPGTPPGAVPTIAAAAPAGPMLAEGTPLLAAIAPWIGTPYVFGGNTRAGVDCSGFTLAIYRDVFRVQLPRTAQSQYNVMQHPANPEFGDLVFFAGTYDSRPDFISHVGIYIGDGWMESAIQPTLGRQNLSTPYWRQHFVAWGRIAHG